MIIDSSALIAIFFKEPEARAFARAIQDADTLRISAATYLETAILLDKQRDPVLSARLDTLIEDLQVTIEPITVQQARIARQAWRDYGRGSGHPANLNFGDCFSYALSRAVREPLLYKGNDFSHTDLSSALHP